MTSWTVIAETGARFAAFGPFVASIDDDGLVAFQASLADGGTGVFTGRGADVAQIALPPPVSTITSHPDVNGGVRSASTARSRPASTASSSSRTGS